MKKAESLQDFLTSEGYIKVQMKRSVAGHFEIDAEVENRSVFAPGRYGCREDRFTYGNGRVAWNRLENSAEGGGGSGTTRAAMSSAVLKMFQIGSLQMESFPMYMMFRPCNLRH